LAPAETWLELSGGATDPSVEAGPATAPKKVSSNDLALSFALRSAASTHPSLFRTTRWLIQRTALSKANQPVPSHAPPV
jgi:hypothetical protein